MSKNNLWREEAAQRAALLAVESYDIELDLTDASGEKPGEETFRSRTVIRFSATEHGASTFLDLTAPTLLSATLNGTPVEDFDGNRLQLPGLAAENELVVEAEMAYMRTGEGLHRFVDPVDGGVYLYSQFETFDAHRVYGCFDQPDLKAPFRFTIRAPRDWEVISNGAVTDRPAVGEPGTWRFAETPRMSTYITAVVAGPYHCVRDTHDGIDLGIYCRGSLAEYLDADELFLITKQGFDFYQRVFDYRYPFGKYDQLFVPEFNAGAMENAAAVTFLE
ncbi:MAG: aminopeptidase, partial [Frankiales bacterium]|nr:aminopeptidase [Frankiales bacterium]